MRKKRKIEIIIVIIVVLLVGAFIGLRKYQSDQLKEAALIDELRAVRMGVSLYREMNKTLPPNLKVVAQGTFTTPAGNEKEYLPKFDVDEEGYPIDAFGNRFNYDPETGRVWPSEDEYSDW